MSASSEDAAWRMVVAEARRVLRTYSTSFFLVTRFLPAAKRAQVEAIYAAVRYPDEVVDTFPLSVEAKESRLNAWRNHYRVALTRTSLQENLRNGVPVFVAGFAKVAQDTGIPAEHYFAFLDAMQLDARPRAFSTMSDLIDSYVYGSAIVVGYFLSHVYGSKTPGDFGRALESARALGIALQLTNFLRDVAEDQNRHRVYLPADLLRAEGIELFDATNPAQHAAIARVITKMAAYAEANYQIAADNLDAFAPDSRTAIQACIDVYRQLNERVGVNTGTILHRESVPMAKKFRALPPSKYWRLPLAYLTR